MIHNFDFVTIQFTSPLAFVLGAVWLMCFPRDHLQLCTFYLVDLFRRAFLQSSVCSHCLTCISASETNTGPYLWGGRFFFLLHLSSFILGSLSYRDELGTLFRLLRVLAHVLVQASAKSEFLEVLEVIEN